MAGGNDVLFYCTILQFVEEIRTFVRNVRTASNLGKIYTKYLVTKI